MEDLLIIVMLIELFGHQQVLKIANDIVCLKNFFVPLLKDGRQPNRQIVLVEIS